MTAPNLAFYDYILSFSPRFCSRYHFGALRCTFVVAVPPRRVFRWQKRTFGALGSYSGPQNATLLQSELMGREIARLCHMRTLLYHLRHRFRLVQVHGAECGPAGWTGLRIRGMKISRALRTFANINLDILYFGISYMPGDWMVVDSSPASTCQRPTANIDSRRPTHVGRRKESPSPRTGRRTMLGLKTTSIEGNFKTD